MQQLLREHIVVKVPSIFIEEINQPGGLNLVMNVMYRPERHVRCYGEVISVPEVLSKVPIAATSHGRPGYTSRIPEQYKTADDIELELRVGDRAYFHYNCLLPDMNTSNYNSYFMGTAIEKLGNGEPQLYYFFRVKYELVFAAVRYEKTNEQAPKFEWWMESQFTKTSMPIHNDLDDDTCELNAESEDRYVYKDWSYQKKEIMIGSYILVEPDKESWDDIAIPVPETLDGRILYDIKGMPRMKPKEEWIVTKQMPGNKPLCGWVRHVGTPLKGDVCRLKVGTYVLFQNNADTFLNYEGEELYRLRQRHVDYYAPHKFREPVKEPSHQLEATPLV